MWITQTYLGEIEPNAKVFVYYFFEDYESEQTAFTRKVQEKLENLGDVFGDDVSLFMPNPRYAEQIEAEMRDRDQFKSLKGKLPGLFLSRKPLAVLTPDDECVYIPFGTKKDEEDVVKVIRRIREIARDTLNWDFANQQKPETKSFSEKLFEAVEVELGVGPIKINLRKLFQE